MYTQINDAVLIDLAAYEAEQYRQEMAAPICRTCRQHITGQETAVRIGDRYYCDKCLDEMREVLPDGD